MLPPLISTPFTQAHATVISHLNDGKIHISVSLLLSSCCLHPQSIPNNSQSDYLKIHVRLHYSTTEHSSVASITGRVRMYKTLHALSSSPNSYTILQNFSPTVSVGSTTLQPSAFMNKPESSCPRTFAHAICLLPGRVFSLNILSS